MRISLINNMIALVDPCNSDLQDLKWRSVRTGGDINVRFYAIRGKNIKMHRVVMERHLGRPLKRNELIDHVNCNGLDNHIKNLRVVDARQNSQHVRPRGGNKSSIYKGVSFNKSCNRWQAYIYDKKHIHLGLFDSEIDAAIAYDRAAEEVFGEYSYLNFPKPPARRASKKQFLKVGLL